MKSDLLRKLVGMTYKIDRQMNYVWTCKFSSAETDRRF